jgi:Glyoxalase-like domain
MNDESPVRQVQLTFDAADPGALCEFWCAVLGYVLPAPPGGAASWAEFLEAQGVPEDRRNDAAACEDPSGTGPRLFFQRVPEGKSAKNRVHLDVRAAPGLPPEERMPALEAGCERLVALGATRVERNEPSALSMGFIVMQDPEGNEFCLD